MKSKVALTKSGKRVENIEAALQLIKSEIDLETKSDVFIKVNLVSTRNQLASTHVDSVRALLRFLRERYSGKITIGESTVGSAREGYVRFGYLDLVEEFDVELVDLNEGEWQALEVYDSALRPMKVRFAKQLTDSSYRISICPAKTHDVVVVTLSIKNLAMGGLCYTTGDKSRMHQGYPVHNLNLYLLAKAYPPHLSIIDGYVGMEGNGPISGNPAEWGVAIVSQDPVAADCLAAQLMGFDISDIGYLWYCYKKGVGVGVGEISEMDILGANSQDCYHRFRPHSTYEAQKGWRDESVSRLLKI